ncbi:MAG: hypothetical protein AAF892_17130 [Cyanobacteria bacterium P01_D01_bin.71]
MRGIGGACPQGFGVTEETNVWGLKHLKVADISELPAAAVMADDIGQNADLNDILPGSRTVIIYLFNIILSQGAALSLESWDGLRSAYSLSF